MSNARVILDLLDSKLDSAIELTLYGRAALSLGFENPPEEFGQSRDIDAVLARGQAEDLLATTNFWTAIDETNAALAEANLYVSHLFVEDQVTLTADWKTSRVAIEGTWQRLDLFRLGDEDLLLSKLMRDDPHDRGDALFIAQRAGLGRLAVEELLAKAVMPRSVELEEQFASASRHLLAALQ